MKALLAIATTSVALIMTVPATSAEGVATTPTCQGRTATIVAAGGMVSGTPGDDVIVVSGGSANVDAGDGDDTVCSTATSVTITAGAGDDVVDLSAQGPSDVSNVDLGDGSDTYLGGVNQDYVRSGPGAGHDVISTGDGRDKVFVSSATADVSTGNGHDRVTLEPGDLTGGSLRLGRARDAVIMFSQDAAASADLARHTLGFAGASYSLAAAELVYASAEKVHLRGDDHRNGLYAYACRTYLVGKGDRDLLDVMGVGSYAGLPPLACASRTASVFGGDGDDRLEAEQGRGLLDGGAGFDHARVIHGRFTCHAERTSGHCR